MGKVVDLSNLHEKYYDQGFRVVAVSTESSQKLRGLVDQRAPKYWIASDPADETSAMYGSGPRGIPQSYLVDARGIVVAQHIPDEDEIRELLAGRFDPSLGRELHGALEDAVALYQHGAYGLALRAAEKHAESKDEAVAADARFLVEKIHGCEKFQREFSAAALPHRTTKERYAILIGLEHAFPRMDTGKWAEKQAMELAKEEDVHVERNEWRKFETALAAELKAAGDANGVGRATKLYEEIIAKWPRSQAAIESKKRLADLAASNAKR